MDSVYEWGDWATCTCEEGETDGTQTRSQVCTQPQNGGQDCAAQGLSAQPDETKTDYAFST